VEASELSMFRPLSVKFLKASHVKKKVPGKLGDKERVVLSKIMMSSRIAMSYIIIGNSYVSFSLL
jgi:hypothetical protein